MKINKNKLMNEIQLLEEKTNFIKNQVNIIRETTNKGNITNHSSNKDGRNFYSSSEFFFLEVMDKNYSEIRKELDKIINENSSVFQPWIEKELYEESNPSGWDIAPIMINKEFVEENCKIAPFLYEIISKIPNIVSCSYSLLKPGTRICPHKGYDDYSEKNLRYHLGLIIPKGDLGLRVCDEIVEWKEGSSFVFDDFKIHEAWNFSECDRYVLICDFVI